MRGCGRKLSCVVRLGGGKAFFMRKFTTLLLEEVLAPFTANFISLRSPTNINVTKIVCSCSKDMCISSRTQVVTHFGGCCFELNGIGRGDCRRVFGKRLLRRVVSSTYARYLPTYTSYIFRPCYKTSPMHGVSRRKSVMNFEPAGRVYGGAGSVVRCLFRLLRGRSPRVGGVF